MKTNINRFIVNRDGSKEIWYKSGLIRHYSKSWKPYKTVQKFVSNAVIFTTIDGSTLFKLERDTI